MIKRIGVFTSGGDAPGMNAAIRAVVRTALHYNLEVYGIYLGYEGMIQNQICKLSSRDVSNIIQRGGTILKSARSDAFMKKEGRQEACENLKTNNIDALVAIGGDGTFTGAKIFQEEFGIPVVGIPGTIDNDIYGTDYTIGYDTATNTVIDAVDKIRDTAFSHNRLFFIEVMGRHSGFIAARCAVAAGAEAVLIPEKPMSVDALIQKLEAGAKRNKTSSLVIVAEGEANGGAAAIARKVEEKFSYYKTKVTILGHIQRGGSPSVFDRELASRLGVAAVETLLERNSGVMVGWVNNKVKLTPFEEAVRFKPELDDELFRVAKILSY
ncbi:MAG: 6-phosphofructokinase [Bacteroidetes bacterium]|nr:MAG: 6-phosphofructokinase [Bacteroidota bacterium]